MLREAHQVIQIEVGNSWLSPSDSRIEIGDGPCLDFWGIAIGTDGTFEGRQLGGSRPMTLLDASIGTGEWTGLFRGVTQHQQSYVFLNDYSGFQSAYWTVIKCGQRTFALCSSSFQALLVRLREMGQNTQVDWLAGVQMLAGNMNTFQSPTSVYTAASGVWMLRRDDVFVANAHGVGLLPRETLVRRVPMPMDYHSLIRRGIDKAINGLQSITKYSDEEPLLFLSGGKDSRSVLALIQAAGLTRSVGVQTHDPSIRPEGPMRDLLAKDLRIASGLVSKLNMHWARPSPRTGIAVTLEEHLSYWQKYRANWNYTYAANNMLGVARRPRPHVQIWGAGGEILRGYFASQVLPSRPWWTDVATHLDKPSLVGAEFYNNVAPRHAIDTALHWNARAAFVAEITRGGSRETTWDEMANAFYRDYRHASHFGQRNMAWPSGTLQWYPLVQTEFLLAYETLAPSEAVHGKCQFDLIEAIDPRFNDWEYESGPWPERVGFSHKRVEPIEKVENTLDSWESRGQPRGHGTGFRVLSPSHEIESKRFDRRASTLERLRANIEILSNDTTSKYGTAEREDAPGGAIRRFLRRIDSEGQKYDVRAGYHLAKTETLRGVLRPEEIQTHFNLHQPQVSSTERRTESESLHLAAHPSPLRRIFGDPSLSILISQAKLSATIHLQADDGLTEWSFYVYDSVQRMHTVPYSRVPGLHLSVSALQRYRVVAFLRRIDTAAPGIILSVESQDGDTKQHSSL